jgi:membrane associated rhomboid family serine protease
MARRRYARRFRFWRIDMPLTVAVLCALYIVTTLACWSLDHSPYPGSMWIMLTGEKVWSGEVWRVLTYAFGEDQPWNFIFGVLMIYWFGKDLCDAWGGRRFVLVYLGLAASSAIVVCLVGRFLYPFANVYPHLTMMPIADGMVILWALRFRDRVVQLYFVMQVQGKSLVWITLILTGVFAARYGLSALLPHLAAEAIVLLSASQPRRLWLRIRQERLNRQMRRYVDNVRRIDGRDDDDQSPPGPPTGKLLN